MSTNLQTDVTSHPRAIRILNCLQNGAAYNTKQLADRLNVSRRTIFRDISSIREAGIDIVYDEDKGAYCIRKETAAGLKRRRVEPDDVVEIVAAAHLALTQGATDVARLLRDLAARLLETCDAGLTEDLEKVLDCSIFRLPADQDASSAFSTMKTIVEALYRGRLVVLTIRDDEFGQPERTRFAPYRVEASDHSWRLVGWSSLHNAVREFDIRRLTQVDITSEAYTLPELP